MLVGPAGAGKSAVAECLAAALTDLGTKHVIWRMNPKVALLTEPVLQMFRGQGPANIHPPMPCRSAMLAS